jgi:hypothetical protein
VFGLSVKIMRAGLLVHTFQYGQMRYHFRSVLPLVAFSTMNLGNGQMNDPEDPYPDLNPVKMTK